jgi:hypothetical protein
VRATWAGSGPAGSRPGQDDQRRQARVEEPELAEDAQFSDLDRAVRGRLRTLSKENAEAVGRHLVMVGRLLEADPELAYLHAQAAVRRAGRVDVVREAAALAAYGTQRFAEALRELRTVRRLSGSAEHLAMIADCERGLGRPERAVLLARDPDVDTLSAHAAVELAIVLSGARLDLGEPEAAVAVLAAPQVRAATGALAVRVAQARATALEAAGQPAAAAAELASIGSGGSDEVDDDEEDVVVFDLDEEVPGESAPAAGTPEAGAAPATDGSSGDASAGPTEVAEPDPAPTEAAGPASAPVEVDEGGR